MNSLIMYCSLVFFITVFIYSFIIEPHRIITRVTDLSRGLSTKIVLISDLHNGIYQDSSFTDRVVTNINHLKPDYVFIAGDFIYHATPHEVKDLAESLGHIQAPVYAVLGNHDADDVGSPFTAHLIQTLSDQGIHLIDNTSLSLPGFTLIGLGDRWTNREQFSLISEQKNNQPIIILAHNPDTAHDLPQGIKNVLMLSGHTHGGQIRIPFLYHIALNTVTQYGYDRGLYTIPQGNLYISPGLGMVGLPFRFLNPPVIDVIQL